MLLLTPSVSGLFKAVAKDQQLLKCLHDRDAALRELAAAARRVDTAAFGEAGDFGQAHQVLLKALERADDFLTRSHG